MHARSWVSRISAAVLVLGLGIAVNACSKQSEGERCSTQNGNDDCESPLQCIASLCCPPNTANATTAACKGTGGATDSGTDSALPETPADTGVDTTPATDTTPDADAPAEVAIDATDAETAD